MLLIMGLLVLARWVHAAAPATFKVSEFEFSRPEAWKWVEPSSSMRQAQLAVPGKEEGEVVFFYFGPGGGGGVDANVSRWFSQFKEPRDEQNTQVDRKTVNGVRITYVRAEGTFMTGPPFGAKTPKPGYLMKAAILEGKEGNVFVKMTGEKAVIEPAQEVFRKMVEDAVTPK